MSPVWTCSSLLLLILVNTVSCLERPSFKLLGDEIRNKLLKLTEEYSTKDADKNVNENSDLKDEENNLKQMEEFNFFNSTEENDSMNGSSIETRAMRNGYYPVNNYGQYYPGFVAPNPYGAAFNNFIPVGYIANPNVGYDNMNQNSRFVNGLPYNNIPSTAPIFGGTISNPNLAAFYNNAGFSGHGANTGFGNGANNNFGSTPNFVNQNNPSLGFRESGYNGGGFNTAPNINPSFGGYTGGNPSNFNSGYNNGYPNSGYNGGNPNMGFNGGNQNFGANNQNMAYNSNNNPNGMTNPNTGFPITNSNSGVSNSKPNSGSFNANVNSKPNNGNNNIGTNSGLVQPYGTNGPTNNNGNSGTRYTNLANSPPKPFDGTSAGAPVTAKPIFSGVKVA